MENFENVNKSVDKLWTPDIGRETTEGELDEERAAKTATWDARYARAALFAGARRFYLAREARRHRELSGFINGSLEASADVAH
jgi:hypothetical protein